MVWALLALLGVPIWLVVGGLAGALYSRSQVKKTPAIFPARLRIVSGSACGVGEKWSRMPVYAHWVHDVLLVHSGLPLARMTPVPVSEMSGEAVAADPSELKKLGDAPVIRTIHLDNGAVVEMAMPGEVHELGQGPFSEVKS